MARRHQAVKKSEYRNNYLPFDYYDFCITAKENENLRHRNKLRDYLHTPFDWDECLDYYIEPLADDNLNQATQTTERPVSRQHNESKHKEIAKEIKNSHYYDSENQSRNSKIKNNQYKCDHHHNHYGNYQNNQEQMQNKNKSNKKYVTPKPPPLQLSATSQTSSSSASLSSASATSSSSLSASMLPVKEKKSKSNGIEINAFAKKSSNSTKKSSSKQQKKRSHSLTINKPDKKLNFKQQNEPHYSDNLRKKSSNNNVESLKNIANMSVQTPPAWNLRDHKPKKLPLNKGTNKIDYLEIF
jgi:hypothetical protein